MISLTARSLRGQGTAAEITRSRSDTPCRADRETLTARRFEANRSRNYG
jgi:hypothetical protein